MTYTLLKSRFWVAVVADVEEIWNRDHCITIATDALLSQIVDREQEPQGDVRPTSTPDRINISLSKYMKQP
ncbi:hypothetical protein IQ235_11395 [Oscillatoriales cyanobacterium LEGE 11467]|uniref:Uncharacterized protein n=1 Tax=Zarconia navalis LEGE 11467 TaxID=1828826 RepID=A0A928VZW7_9CYAN|nr:hypothetical protein [Zarconia navalis]MBE9041386.1 hypothetical protein [Zarconia navalis LEGE 11467]